MKMLLPEDVEHIIKKLESNNYEAFVVGGCVRDSLLGLKPKDWDITTSAFPEEILSLFKHTIPTGLQHGTVTVVLSKINYEITTYRIDGDYSDGRHPDEVIFTSSLPEDLSRRDFTVNAMAYNPSTGLIDPFEGKKSLTEKTVKCVGNPDLRFNEDALRMLRAIRFSSQLDFNIEEHTYKSIYENSALINKVSSERVREELCKMLMSKFPAKAIKTLHLTGLLRYILPELDACVDFNQRNPHHNKDVFEHIISVVESSPEDLEVRLAALFHDIAKPVTFSVDENGTGHFYKHDLVGSEMTEKIMRRLKFDNVTIKNVCILIGNHMTGYSTLKESSVKKLISRVGTENLDRLFELQMADTKGHAGPYDFTNILNNKETAKKVLQEKQPLSLKDLNINGNDLIALGFQPGKALGETLNSLLDIILENPEFNTREKLLQLAKEKKL